LAVSSHRRKAGPPFPRSYASHCQLPTDNRQRISNTILILLMYPSNANGAIISAPKRHLVTYGTRNTYHATRITQHVSLTMTIQPICANCGIAIHWQPTIVDGRIYCCLGCAVGGPCTCDYSNLPRVGEFRAIICSTRVIVLPPHNAGRDLNRTDAEVAE